jgi:hypothetical protein
MAARIQSECQEKAGPGWNVGDVSHPQPAVRPRPKEAGFIDGQNVAIAYRYAENQNDRLPAPVAELIWRRAAVIGVNIGAYWVQGRARALAAKIGFEIDQCLEEHRV